MFYLCIENTFQITILISIYLFLLVISNISHKNGFEKIKQNYRIFVIVTSQSRLTGFSGIHSNRNTGLYQLTGILKKSTFLFFVKTRKTVLHFVKHRMTGH